MAGDHELHEEIRLALEAGAPVDGSAPEMGGKNLNAYVAAGIRSDHEAISLKEGIERLRLGMRLVIREGSGMRNLSELIKIITEKRLNPHRCCFCTDDKDIREIVKEGTIDYIVRRAIETGADPLLAIQIASLNAAEHLRVDQDLGSIGPGKIADILFIDDLERFSVRRVMVNGRVIAENGRLLVEIPQPRYLEWMLKTIHLKRKLTPADFIIETEKEAQVRVRVIDVSGNRIVSGEEAETLPVKEGRIYPDPAKDILKVVVVERYGKTPPNVGKGFIKGFGFKRGALATSITPDVHHLIAVGDNDTDLTEAVNRLVEMQGGIVLCREGRILGELALPIGGIMSQESYEKTAAKLEKLYEVAKEFGCLLPSPFMTLAFVGCPALTKLKLSDKGLIDVIAGKIVALELE
jgi:adenine deaminase